MNESGSQIDVDDIDVQTQTETVGMRRAETISGYRVNDGYRFTVTDAIRAAGFTPEMIRDHDLYIRFTERPDGGVTGIVVNESDVPDGHYDRHHKIYDNTYSFLVYFTPDQLARYGLEIEDDRPPIFDTWGGEGGIALTPMDIQEVVYERELTRPIDALPDRMKQDYIAVEKEGYTHRELAEEYAEQMDSTIANIEWNIEQNVVEAKRRLNKYEQGGN